MDFKFLENVEVFRFRNLRKLWCSAEICNQHLRDLPLLTHLWFPMNDNITDDGLLHLQLIFLFVNDKITDRGIKHMKLRHLDVDYNSHITNAGIQDMPLRILNISRQKNLITGEVLKNFQLEELYTRCNSNVKDKHIKMLKLRVLDASGFSNKISDEGIKDMNLEVLLCDYNKNITNEGIKKMRLSKLSLIGNHIITGQGLIGSITTLTLLSIDDCSFMTDDDIRSLKMLRHLNIECNKILTDNALKELQHLETLSINGTNITDTGISHMKNLRFLFVSGYITDKGLQNSAKTLRTLSVKQNWLITNQGLINMNLRKLHAHSSNITLGAIDHMTSCKIYC